MVEVLINETPLVSSLNGWSLRMFQNAKRSKTILLWSTPYRTKYYSFMSKNEESILNAFVGILKAFGRLAMKGECYGYKKSQKAEEMIRRYYLLSHEAR